jgi:hypothetical protein
MLQQDLTQPDSDASAAGFNWQFDNATPSYALAGSSWGRLIDPSIEANLVVKLVGTAPARRKYQELNGQIVETSVRTIDRFIKLVRDLELRNSLPRGLYTPNKPFISALRHIFYTGSGWEVLIPGSAGSGRFFQLENGVPFGISRTRSRYTPEIWKAQEVKLNDGNYVDMGHVLVAIDAVNYPDKVPLKVGGLPTNLYQAAVIGGLVPNLEFQSNIDATTWVGDFAPILNRLLAQKKSGLTLGAPEIQAIIDDEAEMQDLLGNIDGYVIAKQYRSSLALAAPNAKPSVSSILTDYYRNYNSARLERFSIFAELLGLGELENGAFKGGQHAFNHNASWFSGKSTFASEDEWLDYYAKEVVNAAVLFRVSNNQSLLKRALPGADSATQNALKQFKDFNNIILSATEDAKSLLRLFLNTLKSRID